MAAPALCRAFSQNAWRRDLCSNCFRSKEEHKAAAAARQRNPLDAARLASNAIVKSILKGSSKSVNGVGKKSRNGVTFPKEESQVIGYGGDDEIHSADEECEMEEVDPPSEGELEREKAEQQALERLTKANTDFNSVIANLQLESITQEKQAAAKGSASGIPVPGGRSTYTGPLRLGLGSKDGDGNKKTLLVSVRPFGSDGEEISKGVAKTRILVTNGISSNGTTKDSKDNPKMPVNGTVTNGFGYSAVTSSKEVSVKVSKSSNVIESKSFVPNGVNSSGKGPSLVNSSNPPKGSDKLQSDKIVNGHSEKGELKINSAESDKAEPEASRRAIDTKPAENGPTNSAATSSKIGIPVPATRSLAQQSNLEVCNELKQNSQIKVEKNPSLVDNISGDLVLNAQLKKNVANDGDSVSSEKGKTDDHTSPIDHVIIAAKSEKLTNGTENKLEADMGKSQPTPVPAERNLNHSIKETISEDKPVTKNESSTIEVENTSQKCIEQSCGNSSKINNIENSFPTQKSSNSGEATMRNSKEATSSDRGETRNSHDEEKCVKSDVFSHLQVNSSSGVKKNLPTKALEPRQEGHQNVKNPEGISTAADKKPMSSKSSTNSHAVHLQKSLPVTKRPAPSILKMSVPSGWNSKNASQKNAGLASPTKDCTEEKASSERANIVNGILKAQPVAGSPVGQEKPLKQTNTIAKLRANFVNNNLKIIAESAAKIVNGTRYGSKNVVADEIPISKSSVMNLSMRPISTNSRSSNKSFHMDDSELKCQSVKGLTNADKVSNSFPSIKAKGSGPDIRELLRTPEREGECISFPIKDTSKKVDDCEAEYAKSDQSHGSAKVDNPQEVLDMTSHTGLDLKVVDIKSSSASAKESSSSEGANSTVSNESILESAIESKSRSAGSIQDGTELQDNSGATSTTHPSPSGADSKKSDCQKEKNCSSDLTEETSHESEHRVSKEEGTKQGSPVKSESGLDKTPPGEKSRKKGIVRRILFKGGNEIYRKAGEMVRSVRRSNESKEEAESSKETEVHKEVKDHDMIGQKPISSEQNNEILISAEDTPFPKVVLAASNCVEEAINPSVTGPGIDCTQKAPEPPLEKTAVISTPAENDVSKDLCEPMKLYDMDEVSPVQDGEPLKSINIVKPDVVTPLGTQPPAMAPRPSFLHGKAASAQPWSSGRNTAGNTSANLPPSIRTERAASMSALVSNNGTNVTLGQRGRLSSLPSAESEAKASPVGYTSQGPPLRKPGPIVSGAKPAIPAKPSKILEASAVKHGGGTPQHNRPAGERRGSTSMATPGSVGRSAGKRQAPKPPGMDASQRRGSNDECPIGGNLETNDDLIAQNLNQVASSSPNEEELAQDDLASAARGTHFVKNQALNASKSSSRVAREMERRQMLLQMQSNGARGAVHQVEGSNEGGKVACPVPSSILQAANNGTLTARQRSASLGRGVGVASPRPPLPGGSLGRAAGEGAALTIAGSSEKLSAVKNDEGGTQSQSPSPSALTMANESSNLDNTNVVGFKTNSPVRSRSEGSLATRIPLTPTDDSKNASKAMMFDSPMGASPVIRGEEIIYDSPSGLNISGKKKRNTVRGFLKFLRRGSVRDEGFGTPIENKEDLPVDTEPKSRPVIVHPLELDGACVEVVKGGGVDVRRRLEEESALEITKSGETCSSAPNEQSQNSPRRPSSISIAPPRPPPVQSPSSPSLSSSSSSSCGSTPVRPRPPPPPRGMAPIPPSPGGSGQKPARPPPPKPAHLIRLGLIDGGATGGAGKSSGDGIYANLGEVRATLTPCKPQRTASMREVLSAASGKSNGELPTPRITPRNVIVGSSDPEITSEPTYSANNHPSQKIESCGNPVEYSTPEVVTCIQSSDRSVGTLKQVEISKGDKLSWNVSAPVMPPLGPKKAMIGLSVVGVDSSSEEENLVAPPLPLAPPPSLPPPLPLHPPPSPPSHTTSSSSSSSIGNALILPEDSGYESVEFHGVHDGEVNAGRWWAENGIATSRGSVITTANDSLEESYEAVVGANHRALADVLAQVCQPNPEEFGSQTTLRWSDFLVEGPKGGVLRSVGPISFHRAALKGRASASGRDSWRRVTLGISASSSNTLPHYFRGCLCHDGGSAPVGRCTPSLRPLCTFQDEIPNRFFSSESVDPSSNTSDLIEATVMVFNPLHLYSLKTYLQELISMRKSGQSFPPLPEESNWCNRACLFLLMLLDTLCSMDCCGGEESLCVIREEGRPGPIVAQGDSPLGDPSHLTCPLPHLCVLPNEMCSSSSVQLSSALCFQNIATQIAEGINGDSSMDSFSHVLQCIHGVLQGNENVLVRCRAALELWFFGPPIFHNILSQSSGDRMQEESSDAMDTSRWAVKNPVLSLSDTEPLSVEGELSHAAPRRWLDLERAGALRSLAVSALHRGNRIPSPLESGLEASNAEEGAAQVGKCCQGWRVGELGGHPTLPTCEEVRLRFLVGTCGSEVSEAWELLARNELPSPVSVVSLGRTYVDGSVRKPIAWTTANPPDIGEAQC